MVGQEKESSGMDHSGGVLRSGLWRHHRGDGFVAVSLEHALSECGEEGALPSPSILSERTNFFPHVEGRSASQKRRANRDVVHAENCAEREGREPS